MSRRSRNGRGQPAPRISSNEKDISKPDLESVKDELFQLFRSGDIDLNDLVAALTENGTPITSEDLDQLSSDISSALKETAPSVPTSQATQPFEEPHVNTTQMQHQARQEREEREEREDQANRDQANRMQQKQQQKTDQRRARKLRHQQKREEQQQQQRQQQQQQQQHQQHQQQQQQQQHHQQRQ